MEIALRRNECGASLAEFSVQQPMNAASNDQDEEVWRFLACVMGALVGSSSVLLLVLLMEHSECCLQLGDYLLLG